MKTFVFLSLVALAAGAAAQAGPWKRRFILGTNFTADYPSGGGFLISKPVIWENKTGGSDRYENIEVLPLPTTPQSIDRIAAGYSYHYAKQNSLDAFTGAWGSPDFLPPHARKVGDYTATEAGWRFAYGDRMKIQLLYEIELGPGCYLTIDFNTYEENYKKLLPVYQRMRDSLKPPEKKKAK
jgi:hypothetical protein